MSGARPLGSLLAPLPAAQAAVPIAGLAYDARRVRPGFLFAAWRGGRADGHDFVPQALAAGAACILSERPLPCGAVPNVVRGDVRRALALAARAFYGDPAAALTTVGITGTNGKTTTAHLVAHVLTAAQRPCGCVGTLGSHFDGVAYGHGLTTPESVDLLALLRAMATAGAAAVALEASSQALHQRRLDGVAFDVVAFTNLSQDHLDYHGDMDRYFAAKAHLFAALGKPDAVAVVNADDPWAARLPALRRCLRYGAAATADVRLEGLQLRPDGMALQVRTPRGPLRLEAALGGRYNAHNVLAALAVGLALDLPDAALVAGIAALRRVAGRLERVSGAGEPLVLVDYAHTPDALRAALGAVRELTAGRLFCVFGAGGDRDAGKRAPMGAAVAAAADWAVLTADNSRSEPFAQIAAALERGLRQGGAAAGAPPPRPGTAPTYAIEPDRGRAIALAVAAAGPADAVLVAGKGHETTQTSGSTVVAFDDRTWARAALDGRRGAAAVAAGAP